jgi:hypothetical protein
MLLRAASILLKSNPTEEIEAEEELNKTRSGE